MYRHYCLESTPLNPFVFQTLKLNAIENQNKKTSILGIPKDKVFEWGNTRSDTKCVVSGWELVTPSLLLDFFFASVL
jgi:hypothetical protein